MPDDVAIDKVLVLERLGATVERVRPASIIDENQFVVSLLISPPLSSLVLTTRTQRAAAHTSLAMST